MPEQKVKGQSHHTVFPHSPLPGNSPKPVLLTFQGGVGITWGSGQKADSASVALGVGGLRICISPSLPNSAKAAAKSHQGLEGQPPGHLSHLFSCLCKLHKSWFGPSGPLLCTTGSRQDPFSTQPKGDGLKSQYSHPCFHPFQKSPLCQRSYFKILFFS